MADKNFFQKLFDNPKKTVYVIVAFIVLFISYLAFAPEAEGAEIEVGPTFTGEFNGGFALVFSERFAGKYDVGLSLISEQDWDDDYRHVNNNGNVWAQYVVQRPERFWKVFPSEIGIGPSVWIKNQDPISGCNLGYILNLKYRFGPDFSVGWRHWSNGGACKPNHGQDLLTFGWRF